MKRTLLSIAVLVALVALPATAAAAPPGELGTPLAGSTFAGAITAGPDGNVWFTAANLSGGGKRVVGKVTLDGKVTEYEAPAGPTAFAGPESIVAGADGNLWFIETGAIGRVTPAGEVTSFPLPATGVSPAALTAGPDGDVWFVAAEPPAIGYIAPSGAVTTLPVEFEGAPTAITAGPAGDLWVTEPRDSRIVRITTAGEATVFKLPAGSRPNSIALGGDGNLWFGDNSQPRVGRITPAGKVSFIPVPTIKGTSKVTAGPGGQIWYVARYEVGSISPEGKAAWPACYGGCEYPPNALTTGPDGRLWIASGIGHCQGYCGGGTEISYLFGNSWIGGYSLPATPFAVGPRVAPVRQGKTSVVVGCGEARACRGTLRLRALVRPPHARDTLRPVGHVSYSLAPGEIKKLVVPFATRRWYHLRYSRAFLVVEAVEGGARVGKRGFAFGAKTGGAAKQF